MALTLHFHPLSSYCWKVLIALYESGTPFEAQMVNLGAPEDRAAFQALWPTAKIPLLVDDGRVVPETSIQIEHLDRRHPGKVRLLPDDPEARLAVRLWDRLFDFYVMTPMQRFVAQHLRPEAERDPRALAEALRELASAYDMIEERRGGALLRVRRRAIPAGPHEARRLFRAADGPPLRPTRDQRGPALVPLLPHTRRDSCAVP